MDCRYWEENGHAMKYENYNSNDGYGRAGDGNLNFAIGVPSDDDTDYCTPGYLKKGKMSRQQQDPMSHRIIEKRRRDRMNNCLADLSRLIPPTYLKKGRGRVEKTEIIEMAIRHLKYLQDRTSGSEQQETVPISVEHFRLGYQECLSEVMRYLVESQGYLPTDGLCSQLCGHLQRHCDNIMKGDQLNKPRSNPETTSSSSVSSSNYAGHNVGLTHDFLRHLDQSHDSRHRNRVSATYCDDAPSPVPQYATDLPDSIDENSALSKATLSRTEYMDSIERSESEPQPSEETIQNQSPYRNETLRSIRKADHPANYGPEYTTPPADEHLHSYKFKNNIKQRFSESQTNGHSQEVHDMSVMRLGCSAARRDQHSASNGKYYKRRRTNTKLPSNYEQDDNIPTETIADEKNINSAEDYKYTQQMDESTSNLQPDNVVPTIQKSIELKTQAKLSGICVPIFALNSVGKFYVPLSIELELLAPSQAWRSALQSRATTAALHPVTINVNFQPHFSHDQEPKSELEDEWQAASPITVSQFKR